MDIQKELGKTKCQKLNEFIETLKARYGYTERRTEYGVEYEFGTAKDKRNILILDIRFYDNNSWRIRLDYLGKTEFYRGTDEINNFVGVCSKYLVLPEETKPNDKSENTSSFEKCLNELFLETLEVIKENGKCVTETVNYNSLRKQFFKYKYNESIGEFSNWLKFYDYMCNKPVYAIGFLNDIVKNTIAKNIVKQLTISKDYENTKYNATIKAESNPICYAHFLEYYGGKCHNLHGHNGKLSIKAKMNDRFLTSRPMLMSYGFLKGFLKHIDKKLDHKTFIHLNPDSVSIKNFDEVTVKTNRLTLTLTDPEGYVLIPAHDNSPYTTSEMTLVNYVIPEFYSYLLDFILSESVDNDSMTMYEVGLEPVVFEFSWAETDSTVCSIEAKA